MTPTTIDKLPTKARDLVESFLRLHEAEATAYVVEAEYKLVTPPLGGDIEELWLIAVCWNLYQEFGGGHWARLTSERFPMHGSKRTVPTWKFIAFDSPRQYTYSTDKQDGCPVLRCEWVAEILRRYRK